MILFIDTATDKACAGISAGGELLASRTSAEKMNHAAWLHPAIQSLIGEAGIRLSDIQAVAVTAGPGSYTGLRVGMSTAKGLCFALGIPLILENTLEVMARAMRASGIPAPDEWLCPMIDARRMEVFTALYDQHGKEQLAAQAMILDKISFEEFLIQNKIRFSGSGAEKWQKIYDSSQALFMPEPARDQTLALMVHDDFRAGILVDTAYAQPFYGKEFYTHGKK